MTSRSLLAGALVLCATAASASDSASNRLSFEPKIAYTAGSDSYRGVDATADLTLPARWKAVGLDGNLLVEPEYSSSSSNASSGTLVTEGLTLGVQGSQFGFNLTGSESPRVDGYLNTAIGGDVSVQFPPRSSEAASVASPEAKAGPETETSALRAPPSYWTFVADTGLNFIHHSDDFDIVTTTTGAAGRRRTRVHDRSFDVEETDWNGSLEAARGLFDVSGEATLSSYSKPLNKAQRAAPILRLPGLHSTLAGFPDEHYTARLSVDLPIVAPYAQYAYTTFKLSQPVEDSFTGGGLIDVGPVEFDASYERDVFAGHEAQQSFATLSASYLFD